MSLLGLCGFTIAGIWSLFVLPIFSLTASPAPGYELEAYSLALIPPAVASFAFLWASKVGFRAETVAGEAPTSRNVLRISVAILLLLLGLFGVFYTVQVLRAIRCGDSCIHWNVRISLSVRPNKRLEPAPPFSNGRIVFVNTRAVRRGSAAGR
jgi:hypothetical protein